MNKTELLLPAGDLERLKYALIYGADAVYVGAKQFSLRAQASNFTIDDLKDGISFAHSLNKKVYVTLNIVPYSKEVEEVLPYLKKLEKIKADGIIVSSPSILKIARENTSLHISLSTQQSVTNYRSVNEFYNNGIKRIVLARELSLKEIKEIRENTKAELEVFIEGGMCSGYSGRCTMSNWMSGRDANRGGCAHSCRWNYHIAENKKIIETEAEFSMASKDLSSISFVPDLLNLGVDSLKIEGRMKSIHYVATVAYALRKLIDDYQKNELKEMSFYENIIEKAENRETFSGFLNSNYNEETIYSLNNQEAGQNFIGIVKEFDDDKMEALIQVRNHFEKDIEVEVMSPGLQERNFNIGIIYKDNEEVDSAKHALEIVKIKSAIKLKKDDILRKVKVK